MRLKTRPKTLLSDEAGMSAAKIALLDDYTSSALDMADWSQLPDGYELTVFTDTLTDPDALVDRLRDFEIICCNRERTAFPAALFDRLPRLRLFVTTGMRNASVDVAAARARGVTVCGTGGSRWSTSEQAWAMLMGLARNIAHDDRMMRSGAWQTRVGVELHGRTLACLGLGRLGGQVAAFGRAFGMEVIAWSQNLTEERCAELGVEMVGRDALFRRADFLTIHLVLSARTRGLVSAREIALMKPTAYLINTSRGPIVEEAALIDALKAGQIAGAAVDVYEQEPLPPDHPLRSLDTVLLTPHVGFVTEEGYRVFYGQTLENILAWHAGKPVRELT